MKITIGQILADQLPVAEIECRLASQGHDRKVTDKSQKVHLAARRRSGLATAVAGPRLSSCQTGRIGFNS